MLKRLMLLCAAFILVLTPTLAQEEEMMSRRDVSISYMEDWPTLPTPFHMRDWGKTALDYYTLVLNPEATPAQFPVTGFLQYDAPTSGGFLGETYTMTTYLKEENPLTQYGEAVSALTTVLGASLIKGMDPRALYGKDFVDMASFIFQRTPDGRGFVSNNGPGDDCTDSFWYTLYPTAIFFQLAAQYPQDEKYEEMMGAVADSWLDALEVINGDWENMGFSLKRMELIKGGHAEPEGVLGVAYVQYMAYLRFGDDKYLQGALRCMEEAQAMEYNPYYEILGSYAPYIAARMNAAGDGTLALEKFLDWVFTDGKGAARSDWGMMQEKWGDYDAYGLSGSLCDTSGYAFAMNTFVTAGAIAPVARYAPQYSRSIGQYLLAVANNSSMFFGDGLPLKLQDDSDYIQNTGIDFLCYEGVRNKGKTIPFGTGDAKNHMPNTTSTNFSFYSGGPLGLMSAMMGTTNVPEILEIDLLKTDFEKDETFPTYLYYNPLNESKTLELEVDGPTDLFDAVTLSYAAKNVTSIAHVEIAPDTALQLVYLPAGTVMEKQGLAYMAEERIVAYDALQIYTNDIKEGQHIHKPIQAALHGVLPKEDAVESFTVMAGAKEVYKGEIVPATVTINPADMDSGVQALTFTVKTKSGASAFISKNIVVTSFQGEPIFQAVGKEILEMSRPQNNFRRNGEVDGKAWFYQDGGMGTIATPWYKEELDLLKTPMLTVDVDAVQGAWGVKVDIKGNEYYLQSDTNQTGECLYDLAGFIKKNNIDAADGRIRFRIFLAGDKSEIYLNRIALQYLE